MIDRRAFIRVGLAVAAAPFIVRAASLMALPVRKTPLERPFRVTYQTSTDGNTWVNEEATQLYMHGGYTTVTLGRSFNVNDIVYVRAVFSRA